MRKITHCSSKWHPKVRSPTTQVRHKITFCPLLVSLSQLLPFSPSSSASSPSRAPPFPHTCSRIRPTFRPIGGPRRHSPPPRQGTETERVTSGIIVAQIAADGGDDALARSTGGIKRGWIMGVALSLGLSVWLTGKGSESWELEVAQSRLAVAKTERVASKLIGRLANHKVKGWFSFFLEYLEKTAQILECFLLLCKLLCHPRDPDNTESLSRTMLP